MKITFTIEMDEKGRITLNGPLNNLVLALGILEAAKVELIEHVRRTKESPLVKPVGALPFPLKAKVGD